MADTTHFGTPRDICGAATPLQGGSLGADQAKTLTIFKRGFSFAVDGPGNRLVYHLCGCNFRCPWCSNPECFSAASLCSTIRVADIIREAVGAKALFFSGGGVTFTGGEPTLQFSPLRDCLAELCECGVHTCMESNASHPELPALFPLIDHLILDCKHHDPVAHEKWTGAPLASVLENIKIAAKEREQLLLRIPLIGGVNASEDDARAFAALLPSLAGAFPVELLRYHEYGKPKWERAGLEYTMQNAEVTQEQAARFAEILRAAGLKVLT